MSLAEVARLGGPRAFVGNRSSHRPRPPSLRTTLSAFRSAAGWLPLIPYLGLGAVLALVTGTITGDAWSRVGNAYYVLFSRDPHLAAIGFVWNPLPSLVELPLLPFAALWPALVDRGFAGNLMSAVFMAIAVRQLWLWLADLAVRTPVRLALTLAFAVHPLIVIYGANGMSEAPFLCFLIVAGRWFSKWLASPSVRALATTGTALAFAYFTRYEAVAAIGAVALATLAVSYVRAGGSRRDRRLMAVADCALVAAPPVAALIAWSAASLIIVGSPFETFTSVYGGSSQIRLGIDYIREATGQGTSAGLVYLAQQLLGLEPLLPFIALAAAAVALARRDPRLIAVLAVLGSVLAFSVGLFVAGSSFGWLRFSITAVPLAVMCAGVIVAEQPSAIARPRPLRTRVRGAIGRVLAAGIVALALIGVPWSLTTVFDQRLAREEAPQLAGLVAGDAVVPHERLEVRLAGDVARYLDSQALPRGSVVVDVALGFWVVLQSRDPQQFVITPDRDFPAIVADPGAFEARYLLVSPAQGAGTFGAIERFHPGLYATGAGMATLVKEFGEPGVSGLSWRLYRVDR